jgi:hypothetical protein
LKGSELTQGDPGRKWNGCVVFQGSNVKDQDSSVVVFQEMTPSASLARVEKFFGFASLGGHSVSQSDAPMAYARTARCVAWSEEPGVPTSVGLVRASSVRCFLGAAQSNNISFRWPREHPQLGVLCPPS